MNIRLATASEIEELRPHAGAFGDLVEGRTWVAEEGGQIIGFLPLRLCFLAEPLMLLPKVRNVSKITRSRAALLLYLTAEAWIRDPSENWTGIAWLFAITRARSVKSWSNRLGWTRIFTKAAFYVKHL